MDKIASLAKVGIVVKTEIFMGAIAALQLLPYF